MILKLETENSEYLARVSKYTYESFICRIYKKLWIFPYKVHEKIFLRKLIANNGLEMAFNTVWDYESGKLR